MQNETIKDKKIENETIKDKKIETTKDKKIETIKDNVELIKRFYGLYLNGVEKSYYSIIVRKILKLFYNKVSLSIVDEEFIVKINKQEFNLFDANIEVNDVIVYDDYCKLGYEKFIENCESTLIKNIDEMINEYVQNEKCQKKESSKDYGINSLLFVVGDKIQKYIQEENDEKEILNKKQINNLNLLEFLEGKKIDSIIRILEKIKEENKEHEKLNDIDKYSNEYEWFHCKFSLEFANKKGEVQIDQNNVQSVSVDMIVYLLNMLDDGFEVYWEDENSEEENTIKKKDILNENEYVCLMFVIYNMNNITESIKNVLGNVNKALEVKLKHQIEKNC